MKRKTVILLSASIVFLLSGCSAVDDQLESLMLEKSEIQQDSEYQEYQKMDEKGQLGENGEFTDTDIFDESTESSEIPSGQVHVTFAANRYLSIRYFTDSELSQEINTENCYLNPGDNIYSSVESVNTNSNLYGISEYRIYDYSDGTQKLKDSKNGNSNLVYTIPNDFTGTELSIIPVGEYPDRNLSMRAYYVDKNGVEQELSNAGTWYINEEECSGNAASISPIDAYVLKFDYDEENYFFVSSAPNCFTESPQEAGFVEFWEAEPTDDDVDYSVQLHPYLSLTITLGEKGTVSLNEGESISVKKNKTWSSDELKYGDIIVIETSGTCTLSKGDFQNVQTAKDPIKGGYRYTLTIAQDGSTDNESVLSVDDYVTLSLSEIGKYGDCTYKLDGKKVSGTVTVQESQKLEVTYTITDNNYKFENSSLWNKGQDFLGNMSRTTTISISPDMNNTTVDPDGYFNIIKK